MIERRTMLRVNRVEWGLDGYQFAYFENDGDTRYLAEPLVLKEFGRNMIIAEPTFSLNDSDCQSLMDELWIAGMRPSKRIVEPQNTDHMNGEIDWLRGVADHLMKRK